MEERNSKMANRILNIMAIPFNNGFFNNLIAAQRPIRALAMKKAFAKLTSCSTDTNFNKTKKANRRWIKTSKPIALYGAPLENFLVRKWREEIGFDNDAISLATPPTTIKCVVIQSPVATIANKPIDSCPNNGYIIPVKRMVNVPVYVVH